jgi:hypothetical protein
MSSKGHKPFRTVFPASLSVRVLFGWTFDFAAPEISSTSSPSSSVERSESLWSFSEPLSESELCSGTFFDGFVHGRVGRGVVPFRTLSFFVLGLSVSRAGRLTPTISSSRARFKPADSVVEIRVPFCCYMHCQLALFSSSKFIFSNFMHGDPGSYVIEPWRSNKRL